MNAPSGATLIESPPEHWFCAQAAYRRVGHPLRREAEEPGVGAVTGYAVLGGAF